MSSTLDRMLEAEITARVTKLVAVPPLTYGVWIRGVGWLKNENGLIFADVRLVVAQQAARLYGRGACVVPVDQALGDLEKLFLQRERLSEQNRWWRRLRLKQRLAQAGRGMVKALGQW